MRRLSSNLFYYKERITNCEKCSCQSELSGLLSCLPAFGENFCEQTGESVRKRAAFVDYLTHSGHQLTHALVQLVRFDHMLGKCLHRFAQRLNGQRVYSNHVQLGYVLFTQRVAVYVQQMFE